MMNYVWAFMILFSVFCSFFYGTAGEVTTALFDGVAAAVTLSVKLLGTLCLWCGIMNIAQQSGLCRMISRLLMPLIRLLFPEYSRDREISEAVAMNMTANLLGLGNAATPTGIEAVRLMRRKNGNKAEATKEMMTFAVINTAALKIIPSTVAALRQAAGSAEPMDIIFCVWISSVLSQFVAVTATKISGRIRRK